MKGLYPILGALLVLGVLGGCATSRGGAGISTATSEEIKQKSGIRHFTSGGASITRERDTEEIVNPDDIVVVESSPVETHSRAHTAGGMSAANEMESSGGSATGSGGPDGNGSSRTRNPSSSIRRHPFFISRDLDYVAKGVEEWGTVGVSAPMMVRVDKNKVNGKSHFLFDLPHNTKFYYDADRVEGAIRFLEAELLDVNVAMTVELEKMMEAMEAYEQAQTAEERAIRQQKLLQTMSAFKALQQLQPGGGGMQKILDNDFLTAGITFMTAYLEADTGSDSQAPSGSQPTGSQPLGSQPSGAQAIGTQPSGSQPSGSADQGDNGGNDDKTDLIKNFFDKIFSTPLTGDLDSVTLSPGKLLSMTATDKMSQDLYTWFASPEHYGDNKVAYFCLMTVGCHPGYRTRSGYNANVMVSTEFARKVNGVLVGASEDPCTSGSIDNFSRPLVTAVYPMAEAQVMDIQNSLRQQMNLIFDLTVLGYGSEAKMMNKYMRRFEKDSRTASAYTVGSAYSANGYNFGFHIEPRFVAAADRNANKSATGNRLESIEFPAMVLMFADESDLTADLAIGDSDNAGCYDHVTLHVEPRWMLSKKNGWWFDKRLKEKEVLKRARRLDRLGKDLDTNVGSLEKSTIQRRRWTHGAAGLGATISMELPKYDN